MADGAGHRATRVQLLERLLRSGVYLVTDDELEPPVMLERLKSALEAGIDVVQFRSKRTGIRDLLEIGGSVAKRCRSNNALFIVNDRADLACALGADGLHVGQDDMPSALAREIIGWRRLLGVSVSFPREAEAAERSGEIDYIGFGAMFPTATKSDAEYAGPELLRTTRPLIRKPIVGIGGITTERAPMVLNAGADAVAVVSTIFRSEDSGRAAAELLSSVRQSRGD